MASKITDDPRIDPRLKGVFGAMDLGGSGDVESREAMLEAANSEEAKAGETMLKAFLDSCDTQEIASSATRSIKIEVD